MAIGNHVLGAMPRKWVNRCSVRLRAYDNGNRAEKIPAADIQKSGARCRPPRRLCSRSLRQHHASIALAPALIERVSPIFKHFRAFTVC